MSSISALLTQSHVSLDIDARDKKEVFEHAAKLLENGSGLTRQHVFDSLMSRERMGSTALGQGIAIPHGRVKGLRDAIGAFLRLRTPIEFEAPDERRVNLIFVLLVPERATDLHLQILSNLAGMFSDRNFRAQLASAPDAASAQRLISNWQPEASQP